MAAGTPPTVTSATYVNATTVNLVLNASAATANLTGQTYTITITALSQNASLAALSTSGGNGDIVPAFAQGTPAYTPQNRSLVGRVRCP